MKEPWDREKARRDLIRWQKIEDVGTIIIVILLIPVLIAIGFFAMDMLVIFGTDGVTSGQETLEMLKIKP